ncbi:Transposase 23 domain-containing protein [Abeliophyllum distichum]|uniref:Transposase 23 domain-containing protein n=1 Tax=Abeliophyllum distichum TaxID=126358 RepID=A0ABD1TJL7_9LAMI
MFILLVYKSIEEEDNHGDKGLNGSDNLQSKKCKLLRWFGKDDVVANGEIASTNPTDLVHHVPLGNECWRVWVTEVVDNVTLYRPTREHFLLEDALGSTIAWPLKYIKVD